MAGAETLGVGGPEAVDNWTETGDVQVGGGPCTEAVDAGTKTDDVYVGVGPYTIAVAVEEVGA